MYAVIPLLLCADTPLALVMRVYGYGLCLYHQQHGRLPDDPLFREFRKSPSHSRLAGVLDGHETDTALVSASDYMADAVSAMKTVQDECIAAVDEILRSSGYYEMDDNPLLLAARDLDMGWLVDKFTRSLKFVCSDGIIREKRWVLEKLAYFSASHNFDASVREIDWSKLYNRGTVRTFLRLIREEKLDDSIDCSTFYELMEFTHSNVHDESAKSKLYSGLAAHGLLGVHSGAITSTEPVCVEIALAVEATETRWWYVMLMQAAKIFGIGMAVDGTTVVLSDRRCTTNLACVDFTKITALKYDMLIRLDTVINHASLSGVLKFILSRLGGVCELTFTSDPNRDLDISAFSRAFSGLRDVTELTFTGMAESDFRCIISLFELGGVKGLHILYIRLGNDLSFITKLKSLERLSMVHCSLTPVHMDTLARYLTGCSGSATPPGIRHIRHIRHIRELDLSRNTLSGMVDLSFIAKLPLLEKLDMSLCSLTSASVNALSGIRDLRVLELGWNDFSGVVDLSFIARLPSLEKLGMQFCRLGITAMRTLCGMRSIRKLNMDHNRFTGTAGIAFLTASLEELHMRECSLTPPLLDALSKLKNLKVLSLSCHYCHCDPSPIADLALLERLSITHISLPSSFLNVLSTGLRELDLCGCRFSGPVDLSFIAKLPSLEILDMSTCGLTSASLCALSGGQRLKMLDLNRNDFSEPFSFITELPSLERLSMMRCNLTLSSLNTLPDTPGLRVLDVSMNDLSGSQNLSKDLCCWRS